MSGQGASRSIAPDLAGALLAVCLGAYAIYETKDMSDLGAVFPTAAGTLCILGGVALTLLAFKNRSRPSDLTLERPDWPRMVALSVVLLAWAVLLKPLGFIISSLVGMTAVVWLTWRGAATVKAVVVHAVALAILMVGFYSLMVFVLRIAVP
ncbi:tripartite tricarboxylate transporter TctB family protein [Litoreibacter roseus]|uniref:DUF1468 domain-containing protein n=1 Tax=Litoreibacter roseus TaxID=2601869 RepID=A0A6N6JKD5_9RHOB|nr:tripartite tricarboxylate transporter TctB family protein [Litoreibacter roseus]GFE66776.1 hypothetical protein KIN_38500 [Litoreibacter roseus]